MLVSTCVYSCSYVYMYVVVCPSYCNRRISSRHFGSIPESDAAVSTPARGVPLPADRYVYSWAAALGSLPECRLCSCPGTYHRAPAVCVADIPSSHQPQQVCHPCLLITIDHYSSRSIDLPPYHLLLLQTHAAKEEQDHRAASSGPHRGLHPSAGVRLARDGVLEVPYFGGLVHLQSE